MRSKKDKKPEKRTSSLGCLLYLLSIFSLFIGFVYSATFVKEGHVAVTNSLLIPYLLAIFFGILALLFCEEGVSE